MRIAVTSQDRQTISQHAGTCRRFWIYDIEQGDITGRRWQATAPLDGIDVLIAGSMDEECYLRLGNKDIRPIITDETDPDLAVTKMLLGLLKHLPVDAECIPDQAPAARRHSHAQSRP